MTDEERLLKANVKANPKRKGIGINKRISANHPNGDEIAIHRKAIAKILSHLKLKPSEFDEFLAYNEEAENIKSEFNEMVAEKEQT